MTMLNAELIEEKLDEFRREEKYNELESPWIMSEADYWNLKIGSRHNINIILPSVWGEDTDDVDWNISRFSVFFSDEEILNNYKLMTDEINDLYKYVKSNKIAHLKQKDVETGLYVIIWNAGKELFVRGRIASIKLKDEITEEEEYRVHAFDFDEYLSVTENEIFGLCTKFLELLPQVLKITMDGLERFKRSLHLLDIMENNNTWKKYKYLEWTIIVTGIKLETVICKINPTDLGVDDANQNFNFDLLQTIWTTCPEPSLPELYSSRPRGFIVSFEEDGKLAIQFDSPYYSTWMEYATESRNKLQVLVMDNPAFQEYVAPLPLDPNEIYMAPYMDIQGPEGYEFFRVKIIPDEPKSEDKPTSEDLKKGEVRLKYIDYGNEEIGTASTLVVASKIHRFMGIVPPMCVEAYMENIYSLDKYRIAEKGIINDVTPFIIKTVQKEDKSKGELGIVQVHRETDEDHEFQKHYQNLSSYLISLKIAIENPNPKCQKSCRKPKGASSVDNPEPVEFYQATYIEMKDWRKDFNLGGRTVLPTLNLNTEGEEEPVEEVEEEKDKQGNHEKKIEEETNIIYFKMGRIRNPHNFTIQNIDAGTRIRNMSDEIRKHVNTRWYVLGKNYFNLAEFTPRWYYGWHWTARKLYCRVRFVRYMEPEGVISKTSKAEVLLVDFAEYTEVELRELERTIPEEICKIPPQTVVAELGRDFLDVFHPAKEALEEEKTKIFREKFDKKIVCGEIKYCKSDKMELTTVFFKNIMHTETVKPSKKKSSNSFKFTFLQNTD